MSDAQSRIFYETRPRVRLQNENINRACVRSLDGGQRAHRFRRRIDRNRRRYCRHSLYTISRNPHPTKGEWCGRSLSGRRATEHVFLPKCQPPPTSRADDYYQATFFGTVFSRHGRCVRRRALRLSLSERTNERINKYVYPDRAATILARVPCVSGRAEISPPRPLLPVCFPRRRTVRPKRAPSGFATPTTNSTCGSSVHLLPCRMVTNSIVRPFPDTSSKRAFGGCRRAFVCRTDDRTTTRGTRVRGPPVPCCRRR